ncbi:MAG: flagellar basal-body MS-ring/collar protein FliF [Myxococcota bacterium]
MELTPARQATLIMTAVGSIAFFMWISNGARTAEYRLLFRGLEDAEMAQVVDGLTSERIEYQLGEGGTAVLVPAPQIHEARMRLASKGLPSGSSPGFEIFDQGSFGVTDFVQKVNYNRALQGELARTIEQVEGVDKARVQLAIPKRKMLLRKDQREATASVVTRLRAGWELDSAQVRGIVHLVASSVEGLDISHVTLVDHRGRLLAPSPDIGMDGPASGASMAAGKRVEKGLEEQIESILERTVGLGRVVAKVSAELDWTQTEKTEEVFDPDSQIARSTQRDTESSRDGVAEGGVAGIVANTPDVETAETGAGGSNSASSRSSETTNFEISKVVSRHVLPTGQIQRLSVAVLVDGKPINAAPSGSGGAADEGAEGGDEQASFAPWSKEELEEFEQLAMRAVGFSAERGDEISVINAPFIEIAPDMEGDGGFLTPDILVLLTSVLHGVAFLIGLLLFSKLFIKPLAEAVGGGDSAAIVDLRSELMQRLDAAQVGALPEGAEGFEGAAALSAGQLSEADRNLPGLPEMTDEMSLQEQVDRLAQLRTEDSVRTIRGWMATGGA